MKKTAGTKTVATKTVAMLMLAAGIAAAAEPTYPVTVCQDGAKTNYTAYARSEAKDMFAKIGVSIDWRGSQNCPAGALKVTFQNDTPESEKPGALAYALPYEGTHIVVFLSRVSRVVPAVVVPKLLAHVLVHEITHILQGVSRHSGTGVMKAHWSYEEYGEMSRQPLPFASADVMIIRHSLALKTAAQTVLAAAEPAEE